MKRHLFTSRLDVLYSPILHNSCCFDSFGFQTLQQMFLQVLYHMFEGFIEIGESNIQSIDIVTGLGSFFIIAIGGTLIGILFGFFGGFITKYTEHVKVIEPLFVFVIGYLMYLTAEMCHLSSILAYVLKKIICVSLNILFRSHNFSIVTMTQKSDIDIVSAEICH